MPLDFSKLSDPAYQEQRRKEREAEEQRIAEEDARIRSAIDACQSHSDTLSDKERRFINSVHLQFSTRQYLSEPQKKWLFDIESRLT